MTESTIALNEYLSKIGMKDNPDYLREAVQFLSQQLIELEAETVIGAKKHERSTQRKTYRNGYRKRYWETRVGKLELSIPKVRQGHFYPSLLEPQKRSEKALIAVVQEAYILGVSTRKMDKLLKSMGLTGIDKSKVSRINKELDALVHQFRQRPLLEQYPYLWLDATVIKVRENHRIVSLSMMIAIGVDPQGERHILDFELSAGESEAAWLDFLRSLRRRGLYDVKLVISDAHTGLKEALSQVFSGATWQRCWVHFMRNLLGQVPRKDRKQVADLVKQIRLHPDRQTAGLFLRTIAEALSSRWPKAAEMLWEAEDDILVYKTFPRTHHRSIYSSNLIERLNREIKRRTKVIGVFPTRDSVMRLIGTILIEIDEEWRSGRRYFSISSMEEMLLPEQEKVFEENPIEVDFSVLMEQLT